MEVNNKKSNKTPGRKKKANPEGWQKHVSRKNRICGKEYLNSNGKIVKAKVFKDTQCNCRRKCHEKISSEDRENNFKQFYELGNQSLQNLFIRGQVHIAEIKKRTPKDSSRGPKAQSFIYYLRVKKCGIRVCKKYFEDTFQIGTKRIRDCTLRENIMDLIVERRGRRGTPANKIDQTDIIEHLKSFRTQSDMMNPESNRITLPSTLTIKKLYQTYLAKCEAENKTPVKEKYFYFVVKKNFNLKFIKVNKNCKKVPQTQQSTSTANQNSPSVLIYSIENFCPKTGKFEMCQNY